MVTWTKTAYVLKKQSYKRSIKNAIVAIYFIYIYIFFLFFTEKNRAKIVLISLNKLIKNLISQNIFKLKDK